MATGITKREQHGDDALVASVANRDAYDLPDNTSTAMLTYEGRLQEAEILKPIELHLLGRANENWSPENLTPNAFALCDNLAGLSQLLQSGQKAQLIYLDPPYNTGLDFHSRGLKHAYKDSRSLPTYIEFMRRRLVLAREVLSDDGSIYLHIGHQMMAHLKVLMDEIFGVENFRNLITRRKCSSKNFTSRQYSNLHDYVLFYSKSKKYIWNQPGKRPTDEWISREYPKFDERGRYKLVPVHAPGTRQGETGKQWRGKNPPPGKHWQYAPSKLDELDSGGLIHWSRTGNPRRKVYLTDDKTIPYSDLWADFRDAHHQSIRITGYPTEKNLEMLKMIVGASSNSGDLVIDPFCGSGTTLHAARDLGRKWIGFDESFVAAEAVLRRLRHGSDPMGDYVESTEDRQSDCLSDLTTESATQEFKFLVDAQVAETFPDHISELAAI